MKTHKCTWDHLGPVTDALNIIRAWQQDRELPASACWQVVLGEEGLRRKPTGLPTLQLRYTGMCGDPVAVVGCVYHVTNKVRPAGADFGWFVLTCDCPNHA